MTQGRSRGTIVFSNEDLLGALRTAAKRLSEPLTTVAYQKAAKTLGLPSHMTIIKRFGTWYEACTAAGVKANPSLVQPRRGSYTVEDCYEAIRDCCIALGYEPSYEQYTLWARIHKRPSGPTVRVKCGDWTSAILASSTTEA